jgi:hypothetical protein
MQRWNSAGRGTLLWIMHPDMQQESGAMIARLHVAARTRNLSLCNFNATFWAMQTAPYGYILNHTADGHDERLARI